MSSSPHHRRAALIQGLVVEDDLRKSQVGEQRLTQVLVTNILSRESKVITKSLQRVMKYKGGPQIRLLLVGTSEYHW